MLRLRNFREPDFTFSPRQLALVHLHHVLAHHLRACGRWQLVRELLDFFDVIADAKAKQGAGDLKTLLGKGDTWTVTS